MTSKSTAPSPLSIFFATRSTKSSTTGMCTGGGVPEPCRLRSRPCCQYSSIEVSVVCMHSMMAVRSDQWRGSLMPSTWVGCSTSCLSQDKIGVLLLAMLVVGGQEREHIAPDPIDGRLDARHRIRPDARGDRD